MEKGLLMSSIVMAVIIITLSSFLKPDVSAITSDNVFLESDLVEFANVDFEKQLDEYGIVDKVTVKWLFHSIANRTINASIDAEFYDEYNNLLYNATNQIFLLPSDYTEQLLLPANTISYEGEDAAKVDYVIIRVTEISEK